MSYISVIGGIIIDIKAHPHVQPIMKTSNPGRIFFSAGGVARNIAENLARLEVPVRLFGKVGHDPMGELLIKSCEDVGIDATAIEKDSQQSSSIDMNMMDQTGDLLISMTDMHISQTISPEYIQRHASTIFSAKYVLTDLNIPLDTLRFIIEQANKKRVPIIIEPVSVLQIEKLREIQGDVFLLSPNEQEWHAFREPSFMLNIHNIIISHGSQGVSHIIEKEINLYQAFSVKVVDTIGAGDALLAGIVFGLFNDFEWRQCIFCGLAAAALTVVSEKTVSPHISKINLERLIIENDA